MTQCKGPFLLEVFSSPKFFTPLKSAAAIEPFFFLELVRLGVKVIFSGRVEKKERRRKTETAILILKG